ncbi:hypothetical protein BDZ94DRAFT_1311581 [Collybia nuda]|uniref:F-box domain-containing protein n=1 Tax=Collybia nuda TaxID=64659 RepID=A0A9P5XZ65_9AGAR|nr:hypothetical protein BDZ94DRAFT_1311581 [Collybia nuda]
MSILASDNHNSLIGPTHHHLPEFPTEIWLLIFRWATWAPDVLDPVRSHDFTRGPPLREQGPVKASLATKIQLVLVCKRWNALASQYLYESILLNKVGSSQNLSNTLDDHKSKRGSFRPLGECTKRIDIVFASLCNYMSPLEIAHELERLPGVFQQLPNLAILNFSVILSGYCGVQVPGSILRSIASTCGPRLEAVIWHTHRLKPPTKDDWLAFITKTPNIKSIRSPTLPFLENNSHESSTLGISECQNRPRLSLLQQLHIPTITELMASGENGAYYPLDDLPSLRRLTMEARAFEQPSYESRILQKYGGSLETLQLIILMLPQRFQQTINIVTQTCTNLTRLDLSFVHFQIMQVAPLPQTIEVLGLKCECRHIDEHTWLSIFDVLWKIGNGHKKLKSIQFLYEANIQELRGRHWKKVVTVVRKLQTDLNIDVHDHMGRPM